MAEKKKKPFLDSISKGAGMGDRQQDEQGKLRSDIVKTFPREEVQTIIPIKQIYKGMIVTEDNRYVKILEVLPINFGLRSHEEQDNIIHLFAGWLRVAPIKMQFKIVTRKADSFEIVNNVRAATANERHPKCRELADNYIDFIERLSEQEALTRRFFIVFEYETTSTKQKTIDEIALEMDEMARKIRGNLAACGNEVVTPQNDDYFQAEILYQFYNRQTCVTEQLAERVIRVTSDTMKEQGLIENVDEYPEIPIPDYIAPRGVDFTNPDYFICDGVYQSILYVQRNGYPTAVNGGWLSSIIESSDGIDIDIILRRQSKATIRDKVALKLKLNRIKVNNREDTDTDFETIEGAVQSAKFIKDSLANGEDFYYMYTFITITAETKDALDRKIEKMVDLLYSRGITTKRIKFRLESAFRVVTPALYFDKELQEFAAQNVMTFGVASTYPFASCEICDANGIVMGINRQYSSLVNLDIFNPKLYRNSNISILGSSGSGKTFTELTMALRMRIMGIQTFIIAPDKAHEFQRACYHIDGSYIRISPGAKSCINIMDIRPSTNPIAEYLDEMDGAENDSWLSQKTSQLLTFFHILIPDITNEEEQLVDEAIIKTYNLRQITHDNDSIFVPGTGRTQVKQMPIIGDLYDVLAESKYTRRVANILSKFVTGSASSFNQQTNVNLNNKFIVFDLQDLTGKMKSVGMFIVMDFLWSKIKENRVERKAVFIDEGWQLIGASSDSRAADFVYRIFKTIRGYGGSAIFATQDISDLFAFENGKYGKAIISNSKIKIVLGMEPQEAKCVEDVLQLTKSEARNITNFDRGEGLICANNNKVPVFIRASDLEHKLITTDPEQLKNIVNQRKKKREQDELAERLTNQARRVQPKENSVEYTETPPSDLEREEVLIHTSEEEKKIASDAQMGVWAMEQLQTATVKEPAPGENGTSFDVDPLVRVEEQDDDFIHQINTEASKFVSSPGESSDHISLDDGDEDLDGAANIEVAESFEDALKKGDIVYGNHPPAEF